jgi:hypothetical protein
LLARVAVALQVGRETAQSVSQIDSLLVQGQLERRDEVDAPRLQHKPGLTREWLTEGEFLLPWAFAAYFK